MKCFSARKRLSPYIDAELEAGEARKLESHLERCRRCAADFEEMAGVHRLFTGVEQFSAPQGFSTRVMGKIHAQSSKDFSLETFEALPPESLGKAYLTMTEERR